MMLIFDEPLLESCNLSFEKIGLWVIVKGWSAQQGTTHNLGLGRWTVNITSSFCLRLMSKDFVFKTLQALSDLFVISL